MGDEGTLRAAIIVVAVLWVAIAAGLAILAARRIARAQAIVGTARRLRALLEAAPSRLLIVRPDETIDAYRLFANMISLGKAEP